MKPVAAKENYYAGIYSYHICYKDFIIDYFTIMSASIRHARKELRKWLKNNELKLIKIKKL